MSLNTLVDDILERHYFREPQCWGHSLVRFRFQNKHVENSIGHRDQKCKKLLFLQKCTLERVLSHSDLSKGVESTQNVNTFATSAENASLI